MAASCRRSACTCSARRTSRRFAHTTRTGGTRSTSRFTRAGCDEGGATAPPSCCSLASARVTQQPRILILTTDIGEGHDLPARQLAEGLAAECPGAKVEIADGLAAMGRLLNAVIKDQSRVIFKMPPWVWNIEHWLAIHFPPTRWLARSLNYALGHRGLQRL